MPPPELAMFASDQYFAYDTADQLDTAYALSYSNTDLYNVKLTYGNYGRINTYNTSFTDPKTNILQTYNNNYTYNTVNPQSNSFAAVNALQITP